jgi:curved DNA-binding protein
MAQDPYQVLGVDKKATQEEISKAYRQLARKYHPDLHPDDENSKKQFQEVQAAFEVLGDEKKRQMYDRYGAGYEAMGGGAGGARGPRPQGWPGGAAPGGEYADFDLNDLFGAGGAAGMGGGGFADLFKHFGQGRGTQAPPRGAPERGHDLEYELTVPFNTAIKGGEASVSLRRGSGKNETIAVKIPAGIEDGKKIRLRGQGEESPMGGPAGDILITVRVAPHPHFTRTGKRLDVEVPVTLAEAIEGAKIDVPTPHGTVSITIPPGTSSGKKLRLRGQGVKPASGEPGDLYAEIEIVLPTNLTDEQRSELAAIAKTDTRNPRADLRW